MTESRVVSWILSAFLAVGISSACANAPKPTQQQLTTCGSQQPLTQRPAQLNGATGITSLAPGMWWDPAKGGTGWDIAQGIDVTTSAYNETFVITWFTFDDAGYPVWFFSSANNGLPDPNGGSYDMDLLYTTWPGSSTFPSLSGGGFPSYVTAGSATLTMIDHTHAVMTWSLGSNSGQSAKSGSDCLQTLTDGQNLLGTGIPTNWAGANGAWPTYSGLIVENLTTPAAYDLTLVMFDSCKPGFQCSGTGRPVWISDGGSGGTDPNGTQSLYYQPQSGAAVLAGTIDLGLPAAGTSGNGSFIPHINFQPPSQPDNRMISWNSGNYPIAATYVAGEIQASPTSTCTALSGQTTCTETVSWRLVDGYPSATAYIADITNGTINPVRTQIATNQPINTTGTAVTLQTGHTYQFELWSTPVNGGGAEFAVAGPVVARVATGPATPPPSVLASDPGDDLVSDGVGATAGTFSVDQQGNANYSIPIYAPRGAGGLTPSISLTYNSGTNDGLVGYGWNIAGISSITPCRETQEHGDGPGVQRGFSGALDLSLSPAYCLDGERMVLIQGPPQVGAMYRLEHDDQTLIVLESVLNFDLNNTHTTYPNVFAVYGKNGSVRRFGSSAAQLSTSTTFTPNGIAIAAWYEYSLKDSNGNEVKFNYECSKYNFGSGSTSDVQTCPTNMDGTRPSASIVPSSITWAGGEIDFNWIVRDPTIQNTNYVITPVTPGGVIQRYRITGITVKSSAGATLRSYTANPAAGESSQTTPLLHIASIKECVNSTCFAPTSFSWTSIAGGGGWNSGQESSPTGTGQFSGVDPGNVRFGDINGDGRADVVWLDNSSGRFHAFLSIPTATGISFGPDLCQQVGACPVNGVWGNDFDRINGANLSTGTWQLFDFDGDGRADLLYFKKLADASFEWEIAQSTGAGFATPLTRIVVPDSGNVGDPAQYTAMPQGGNKLSDRASTYIADFDGDGLPDLMTVGDFGAFVYLLKPTGNFGPGALPYIFQGSYTVQTGDPRYTGSCGIQGLTARNLRIGDFNGDGRADVVVLLYNKCDMDSGGSEPVANISGFSTSDALPGTAITIFGGYFSPIPADNLVQFNGATAVVTSVSAARDQMSVIVPPSGTTGKVCLTLPSGTVCSTADFVVDGTPLQAPLQAPVSDPPAFLQVLMSKGTHDAVSFYFTPGAYWPLGATPFGATPQPVNADYFRVVDLNGDGLADVVFGALDTANTNNSAVWYYSLNLSSGGQGGFSTPTCINGCQQYYGANQVQVGDYDGDGKGDVWLPAANAGSSNCIDTHCSYSIYEWTGNGFSAPVHSPLYASQISTSPTRFTFQVDLDGDGYPDTFMFDNGGSGAWATDRLPNGSPTQHQAIPQNVITQITSGLGANTYIDYSPLTFSSLYYRETNGPSLYSGWGAPVQDVVSPRYVVQYADSSAPTASSPTNTSRVRYRYGGYKVQGYGRGPLGFHQVFTTDEQTNIETVTTYNQAFPLTGTPSSTASYVLASPDTTDACMPSPDASACMAYSNPAPTFAGSTLISQTTDSWAWHPRGSAFINLGVVAGSLNYAVPIDLEHVGSQALKYELDGSTLLSATGVSTNYAFTSSNECYGNILNSTTSEYATAAMTNAVLLRQTTVQNSYSDVIVYPNGGNNYTATWHLGRLGTSYNTATPWSNGTADTAHSLLRKSAFSYDTATGQLTSEVFQPAGTTDQVLVKYHFHDSYGNETETVTCSGTAVAAGACSANTPLADSGMTFELDDPNWVQRYTRTGFDNAGIYPVSTFAPFSNGGSGAVEYTTLNVTSRDAFGNVTDGSDLHGIETRNYFSVLGRQYFSADSTGGASRTLYRWCTGHQPPGVSVTSPCPSAAAYRVDSVFNAGGTARAPEAWVYYDLLGREVLKVQQGFAPTQYSAVKTDYDNLGRVAHVSEPYFTFAPTSSNIGNINGGSIYTTYTQYDILGRVVSIMHPNSSQTTTTYNGLSGFPTTKVTLPANASGISETKTQTKNLLGQVATIRDYNGSTLTNTYDAFGNVLTITRTSHDSTKAATTTMTYDVMGRKSSLSDPDMGNWSYAYNPAGELVKELSSTTCTKTRYDGQGRVWGKGDYFNTACTGTADVGISFSYDTTQYGLGELAQSSSSEGGVSETRTPQYDSFGRVKQVATTIGTASYTDRKTYDQFGRTYQTFFSGAGLPETGELYLYNTQGYLYQIQDGENGLIGQPYQQVLTMDQRGNTTSEVRAANNTLTTTRGYDPAMGWLTSINTNSGAIQNLSYTYDNLGNQKTRSDTTPGTSISETFGYDGLQRLLTQTGSSPTTWSYDDFGNQTSSGTYGTKGSFCTNTGETTPGPDALSVAAGTSNQYCYDGHGNNTRVYNTSGIRLETHTFSADDKLRQTQSSNGYVLHTTTWYYGPGRERIQRSDYANSTGTGTPTVTQYVGNAEIIGVGTATPTIKRYLPGLILSQTSSGFVYEYLFTDNLGSTHRITDQNGNQFSGGAERFTAFGQHANTTNDTVLTLSAQYGFNESLTHHGFTGQEEMDEGGLIHMNGRVYNPLIGRFASADPFIQDPSDLQSYNRYSYVLNNPLVHTDPSGYWGRKEQGYLREAVAIAITIYTAGQASGLVTAAAADTAAGNAAAATALTEQAASMTIASGYLSGFISSGNLKGAVLGALSASANFGIGQALPDDSVFNTSDYYYGAASHAAAGGVLEVLGGGKFGHGFFTAGASSALSPIYDHDSIAIGTIQASIVGGTLSTVTGGKFANGAITAAFSYAFNEGIHRVGTRKADEGRLLTEGEIGAATSEHPDLDTAPVRVKYDMSGSGAYTPNNTIHFPKSESGCLDFSTCNDGTNVGWFVHEVTHVWQYQQGRSPFWGHIFSRDIASFGDYLPLRDYVKTPSSSQLSTEKQADWHMWHYLCTNNLRSGC